MGYKVAIVGVTGLVGRIMLKVFEERALPVDVLIPVASVKSAGQEVVFSGRKIPIVTIEEAIKQQPDIAVFSAGARVSRQYAPVFAEAGTIVIDNSSAWRMDDNVPLVVPEINANTITSEHKIIANPNCSTIQMVVALQPLHEAYGLKKVWVATYQSVTGSGMKAVQQLEAERAGINTKSYYPHPIDLNVLPHGGNFLDNGYTDEEMKLVNESRKILNIPDLKVSPTVVRVPVKGGHSEAISATFKKIVDIRNIRDILAMRKGIKLQDNPYYDIYPMPLFVEGEDDVYIGRLRADLNDPHTLNMWVVADNLRKGAATNAVQIAQHLISEKLLVS
jgi:aspartate-semialdehyde dehydrogenase